MKCNRNPNYKRRRQIDLAGRYFCADCLDKKCKNIEKARAAVDWARHPFRGGAE